MHISSKEYLVGYDFVKLYVKEISIHNLNLGREFYFK